MTILRALLTIPFAIIAFILTAIVSDLVIVELLNAGHSIQLRSMQRAIMPGSVLAGLLIGWYAVPSIFFNSKLANRCKSRVLKSFNNFESRGERLKFVLTCVFFAYYTFLIVMIMQEPLKQAPEIIFSDEPLTVLIIWGPLFALFIYKIIRWVLAGRK